MLARLKLDCRLWLAADIHLGAAAPATAAAFYSFLKQAAHQADALILCGDIFDAWIGDDYAWRRPPKWLQQAVQELTQVASRLDLYLLRGNRDFLLGDAFARLVGAQMLAGPCILETQAGNILLAHGDEYCSADKAYQNFKRVVNWPWLQTLFLALPLALRQRIATSARHHSRSAQRHKAAYIVDVDPQAIVAALSDSGCNIMVHGHTHRPAVHQHVLKDGSSATRYVLSDWDYERHGHHKGGWLSISSQGIHSNNFQPVNR